MTVRALAAASLVVASVQFALGQARDPATAGPQTPAGTGVIGGVVLTADSQRPVRRARVTLTATAASRSVTADDQGSFSFEALPAGSYTLSASKGGMLDVVYGQKAPGSGRPGTAIELANGQRLDRLKLTMPRGGVITGTILDEFGDPSFGVSVRATRYAFRGGVRTLVAAGTATTDDRGMYRITALLPGEYIVSAQSRETAAMDAMRAVELRARVELDVMRAQGYETSWRAAPAPPADPVDAYAVVYYPGSSAGAAATSIALGIGEEKPGIDLQLRRVPVASISGMGVSHDGPQGQELNVQLLDRDQLLPMHGIRSTTARADGRFTFTAVPPGQYTITVFGTAGGPVAAQPAATVDVERMLAAASERLQRAVEARGTPRLPLWATVDVTMSGRPVEGLVLTLQRGMTVSGAAAFEGGPPPADLTKVVLRASMADTGDTTLAFEQPGSAPAPLDGSARFSIAGVVPGRYRIIGSGAGQGFTIKSAVFNGRDVMDFPLEVKPGEDVAGGLVTFTTKSTELGGVLADSSGAPMAEHTIVVFAADSRYWTPQSRRIQAARPSTDGRFTFRGLPAGDYRLVAVTDVEPGQWLQADFFKQLVGGSIPVTLAEGEKKAQDLRIAR
jgi:uncharacterized protein (DUF2141 family)